MPRKKQIVQKQKRRKAYSADSHADATHIKPKGAFRIFTNYRLFAIIGAIVLVGGFGFSAFYRNNRGGGSHATSVRGEGVVKSTPEAGTTSTSGAVATIKQFSAPPPVSIDQNKTYTATIKTVNGDVKIQLLPKDAPAAVNNFVFLAKNGYYDGVTFFRVLPGFVAQTGDPTGTGSGGPGYDLPFEATSQPVDAGTVAMAKPNEAGSPNNGSQFFVALDREPTLDGKSTVFGKVIDGLDVVQNFPKRDPLTERDPDPGPKIESVTITES